MAAQEAQGVPALVTITEQRLNIRSGPGSDYRILGKAQPGEELTAVARTADSQWVRVLRDDLRDGAGWVSTEFVEVEELATLPVDTSVEGEAPAGSRHGLHQPGSAAARRSSLPLPPRPRLLQKLQQRPPPRRRTHLPACPHRRHSPPQARAATEVSAQPAGLEGKIVFHDGRNNIYVYNLATGGVYWLTHGFDPDVSRDGSRVTFMRGGGDVNGIWTINVDGSNERRVHGGGEIMRGPKWSPDGDWIVFSRNFDTDKCYDLGQFFGCLSFFQLQRQFPSLPPEIIYDVIIDDADIVEQMNWNLTRINPDGGDFRDLPVQDFGRGSRLERGRHHLPGTLGHRGHPGPARWPDPPRDPRGLGLGPRLAAGRRAHRLPVQGRQPLGDLVDQPRRQRRRRAHPAGNHAGGPNAQQRRPRLQPRRAAYRLHQQPHGGRGGRPLAPLGDGCRRRQKRPLPVDVEINYGFGGDQVASWGR